LGLSRVEADVGDVHLTGVKTAGCDDEPDLPAVERDRCVGIHRRTGDLAGGRVDAGGKVDRKDACVRVVDLLDQSRRVGARLAGETGAEEGVDDHLGIAELGLPRLRVNDANFLARGVEMAGGDTSVAAVRAAAADDRPPARELHGRLRPPHDLDVLPRERAGDAEPKRLADGLLAGKAARVALRRIRARVAVRLLLRGEAAVTKALVALERAADARDLDQIRADVDHRCSSIHSGRLPIDEMMPSGCVRARSTVSGRNLPVRTRTVFIPIPCAPAASLSGASPADHATSG